MGVGRKPDCRLCPSHWSHWAFLQKNKFIRRITPARSRKQNTRAGAAWYRPNYSANQRREDNEESTNKPPPPRKWPAQNQQLLIKIRQQGPRIQAFTSTSLTSRHIFLSGLRWQLPLGFLRKQQWRLWSASRWFSAKTTSFSYYLFCAFVDLCWCHTPPSPSSRKQQHISHSFCVYVHTTRMHDVCVCHHLGLCRRCSSKSNGNARQQLGRH